MSFLIDTCVLSELTRSEPHVSVARWLKETREESQFTSVLSLGEIAFGILSLPPGRRKTSLENWQAGILRPSLGERVLPFDEAAAQKWALLRARHRAAPVLDSQIAAIALVHGLTLVTRNVKDFAFAGLSVFNPWDK